MKAADGCSQHYLANSQVSRPVITDMSSITATNSPRDIDGAVLSRFHLKIYVSLSDEKACEQILFIHLKGLEYDLSLPKLANECFKNHYSGRDIEALCRPTIWEMMGDRNPFLNKLKQQKTGTCSSDHS